MDIIETKGTQVFSVMNTPYGREFLAFLRSSLNRTQFKLTCRGRAQDRKKKGGSKDAQPLKKADWIAVYIEPVKSKNGLSIFNQGYVAGKSDMRYVLKAKSDIAIIDLRRIMDYMGSEFNPPSSESIHREANP